MNDRLDLADSIPFVFFLFSVSFSPFPSVVIILR